MERLPNNAKITWHIGSKSYCEIYSRFIDGQYPRGLDKIEQRHEALPGKQLVEEIFKTMFHAFLGLAKSRDDREYTYVRCDIEGSKETENNRPFIMPTSERYKKGKEAKDIEYEGYFYHSKIGEVKKYGKKRNRV